MGMWDFVRSSGADQFDLGMPHTVTLTKRHPSVSLSRQGSASGSLRVNLTWRMRSTDFDDQPKPSGGPLHRAFNLFTPEPVQAAGPAMVDVDLDLACMYELEDGTKGVVQALGNFFGSFSEPPYVQLSGDDRFGSASGEWMQINLDQREHIRRLLIFVYIYDGTPAFDRTHAKVTLYPSSGTPIEIALNERASQARSCAVLLMENRKGELVVRREMRYVYGFQSELDRLYGWGLQWGRGYKSRV